MTKRITSKHARQTPSGIWRVRPIAASDLDLLVLHRRRMWEDMGYTKRDGLDDADEVYKKWLGRMRKQKRLDGIVIEDESGTPLASGCVFLYEVHPRPGRPGPYEPYILSMYTEKRHRGRGLARAIVEELLRWSAARGYGAVFLHASDKGRPLYEKVGFVAGREMRWRAGGAR